MSTQNANNVAITGGAISGVTVSSSTISSSTISSGTIGSPVVATTQAVTTNNTTIATTAFVRSIIPAGVILMWSGSVASIPSGWLLCNGASGTPDLRDRFVIGAGSTYAVGATGGATTATLIEANLPSHTHSLSASGTTSTVNVDHTHNLSASGTTSTESANHTHPIGGSTGGQSVSHTHGISDPGHSHTASSVWVSGNGWNPNGGGSYFAIGAPTISASTTGITGTGGASVDHSHTLPANTGTISANHTHTVSVTGTSGAMSANSTHTHTVTVTGTSGATGSGTAFSILPPYFALAYIMKS
jgi:microcystin-dependent protein